MTLDFQSIDIAKRKAPQTSRVQRAPGTYLMFVLTAVVIILCVLSVMLA